MSRRRGRPASRYCIRVRTVRRDPIDYAALAQAALEQAAMNQQGKTDSCETDQHQQLDRRRAVAKGVKDPHHDRLA